MIICCCCLWEALRGSLWGGASSVARRTPRRRRGRQRSPQRSAETRRVDSVRRQIETQHFSARAPRRRREPAAGVLCYSYQRTSRSCGSARVVTVIDSRS